MSKYMNYDSEHEEWSSSDYDEESVDELKECNIPIDRISWEGIHTDALLIMFENMKEYQKSTGIPLFDKLEFSAFLDFAWETSYKYPIKNAYLYQN